MYKLVFSMLATMAATIAANSEPITMRGIHAGQSKAEVEKILAELGFYYLVEASSSGCDTPRTITVFQSDVDRTLAERRLETEEDKSFQPGTGYEIGCATGWFTESELLLANWSYHLATLNFMDGRLERQRYRCRFFEACGMTTHELASAFGDAHAVVLRPAEIRKGFEVKEGYAGRTKYREDIYITKNFRDHGQITIQSDQSPFVTGEPLKPTF